MAEMFFCQVHFDAQLKNTTFFSLSNNHHLCVLCLFGGCKKYQDNNKTTMILLKIKNMFSNWKNKYD